LEEWANIFGRNGIYLRAKNVVEKNVTFFEDLNIASKIEGDFEPGKTNILI